MSDRIDRLGFALCLALLFVWSLPGTVALRGLLLLAALALLARRFAGADFWRHGTTTRGPLLLLALLTLWLLAQAMLLSTETAWALGELRGQWLPAMLALALGLALGLAQTRAPGHPAAAASSRPDLVSTAIVLVFGAQAALAVGHSVWHWFKHGSLLRQLVPLTGGKLEMSFVLNLLLAFLTVDLFCRVTRRPSLLRLPLAAALTIGAIALVSSYLAGARNGIIGIVFLSFSAILLYVFDQRRRLGLVRSLAAAATIVVALAGFATASYRTDPRWQNFSETAAIAWRVDQHRQWLDGPPETWPRLADGSIVNHSNYLRIAFISAGLSLLAEQPAGIGYGRNAFGHAFASHYGLRTGHAHSGWIDLGVGGGWPALALWAAFLASLAWHGWRGFFDRERASGLVLFLATTGYAGRMLLDSVNKDHMLQMFLFLAGVLLILARNRERA